MGGDSGEIDSQQDRSEMALKLGRQAIEMVPLKGGFVKAASRRDLVSNHLQLAASRIPKAVAWTSWKGVWGAIYSSVNSLRTCPALARCSLPSSRVVYTPVLGGGLRRVRVLSDVMNEAVEHVVMDALIPVIHKTQKVQ